MSIVNTFPAKAPTAAAPAYVEFPELVLPYTEEPKEKWVEESSTVDCSTVEEANKLFEGLRTEAEHFDEFLTARCRKAVNRAYQSKNPDFIRASMNVVSRALGKEDAAAVRRFFRFAGFRTSFSKNDGYHAAIVAASQHAAIAAAMKAVTVRTLCVQAQKKDKPAPTGWKGICEEAAKAAEKATKATARCAQDATKRDELVAYLSEEAARKQAAEILALVAGIVEKGGTAASVIDLIKSM